MHFWNNFSLCCSCCCPSWLFHRSGSSRKRLICAPDQTVRLRWSSGCPGEVSVVVAGRRNGWRWCVIAGWNHNWTHTKSYPYYCCYYNFRGTRSRLPIVTFSIGPVLVSRLSRTAFLRQPVAVEQLTSAGRSRVEATIPWTHDETARWKPPAGFASTERRTRNATIQEKHFRL